LALRIALLDHVPFAHIASGHVLISDSTTEADGTTMREKTLS